MLKPEIHEIINKNKEIKLMPCDQIYQKLIDLKPICISNDLKSCLGGRELKSYFFYFFFREVFSGMLLPVPLPFLIVTLPSHQRFSLI